MSVPLFKIFHCLGDSDVASLGMERNLHVITIDKPIPCLTWIGHAHGGSDVKKLCLGTPVFVHPPPVPPSLCSLQ